MLFLNYKWQLYYTSLISISGFDPRVFEFNTLAIKLGVGVIDVTCS